MSNGYVDCMNKELKDRIDRQFRWALEPSDEFEVISVNGVAHPVISVNGVSPPKKLDILKEFVRNFWVMETADKINCAESATLGWFFSSITSPIISYWLERIDESIDNETKLEVIYNALCEDLKDTIDRFNSHLPQIKVRIQNILRDVEEM